MIQNPQPTLYATSPSRLLIGIDRPASYSTLRKTYMAGRNLRSGRASHAGSAGVRLLELGPELGGGAVGGAVGEVED